MAAAAARARPRQTTRPATPWSLQVRPVIGRVGAPFLYRSPSCLHIRSAFPPPPSPRRSPTDRRHRVRPLLNPYTIRRLPLVASMLAAVARRVWSMASGRSCDAAAARRLSPSVRWRARGSLSADAHLSTSSTSRRAGVFIDDKRTNDSKRDPRPTPGRGWRGRSVVRRSAL